MECEIGKKNRTIADIGTLYFVMGLERKEWCVEEGAHSRASRISSIFWQISSTKFWFSSPLSTGFFLGGKSNLNSIEGYGRKNITRFTKSVWHFFTPTIHHVSSLVLLLMVRRRNVSSTSCVISTIHRSVVIKCDRF